MVFSAPHSPPKRTGAPMRCFPYDFSLLAFFRISHSHAPSETSHIFVLLHRY